jgi:hypothetical protein
MQAGYRYEAFYLLDIWHEWRHAHSHDVRPPLANRQRILALGYGRHPGRNASAAYRGFSIAGQTLACATLICPTPAPAA